MTLLGSRARTAAALAVLCGPATAQCLEHRWIGADSALASDFGARVALGGDVAVVGARFQDLAGAAYVYRRTAWSGRWREEQKLRSPDTGPGHELGAAVAVDGERILLGAPGAHGAAPTSGAAYVFRFEAADAVWVRESKLVASDGAPFDAFGAAVALEGDLAVVGAFQASANAGAAYVFRRDPASGVFRERAKLVASDAAPWEHFGHAVSIAGGWIWIGAPLDQDGGGRGTAYAFRMEGGTWREHQRIAPFDVEPGDGFGWALAVSDGEVLAGAPQDDDRGDAAGAVYVFRWVAVSDRWFRVVKLHAEDALPGDRYGIDVALRGGLGAAGTAPNGAGGPGREAAYVVRRTPLGFWRQVARVTALAPGMGSFGRSVAVEGARLLSGAPGPLVPPALGAAYLLELDACPLAGASYCGPAVPNSSGAPAAVHAVGTGNAGDPVRLIARDLPRDQFGFFLVGEHQGLIPAPGGSQGNLCLGLPFGRFSLPGQIRFSGLAGAFELAVDTSGLPTSPPRTVLAGETWSFTAWFRDDHPGPTSNFTDGVAIDFR